ncbi:ribonuclease M5 [Bacillus thermophilus]|uniref:Ribonuclease M5 n=1 Tax=Siminovitchia thermophila TaxID=1245522 RepID=A0ABS2RAL9_9BACI|nr:ribonuclease M5 [Siminovitchia thermophila]MBM7716708.1 ribonuclease M5 [Siminovitchia thermophila]ONK23132.1 ribonuclease M5 [Bacillus sp. VT-16-64]
MKIKEVIVVEGKDDTKAIRRALDADTIETNGSAVSKETIEKIRHAQRKRGVIILTDPDFPGEKIRKTVSDNVPGCKHAFIDKEEAMGKGGKGVGVEHASPEAICLAIKATHTLTEEVKEVITKKELLDAGLIGGMHAARRRARLGQLLKIGYTNGKQLHKRLMMFQVSRKDFLKALEKVRQEEGQ